VANGEHWRLDGPAGKQLAPSHCYQAPSPQADWKALAHAPTYYPGIRGQTAPFAPALNLVMGYDRAERAFCSACGIVVMVTWASLPHIPFRASLRWLTWEKLPEHAFLLAHGLLAGRRKGKKDGACWAWWLRQPPSVYPAAGETCL